MKGKLRYACIGAGGIADKKHLNEYSKLQNIEIVAICDPDMAAAKRLAEKYGVPNVYESYSEMFRQIPLDLVSICTPNFLHAPITIDAMKHGIHVHCEKPLAMNAAEAKAIVDVKNKTGRKVMVALNNRFTAEARFVKKCADEGVFGEIYHVKCGWRRRNGIPGKGVWFTDKKLSGGGALIDLGVHYLDLVLSFMGYPQIDAVFGATYAKFGNCENRLRPGYKSKGDGKFDVEDMAVGFLRMAGGATVDFEFSWASNVEKECKYYEIMGTKGGVAFHNGELKIFTELMGTCIDITPGVNSSVKPVNECEHFVNCILNGGQQDATPEQAAELMKVIDAIYCSAESKKEIIIKEKLRNVI